MSAQSTAVHASAVSFSSEFRGLNWFGLSDGCWMVGRHASDDRSLVHAGHIIIECSCARIRPRIHHGEFEVVTNLAVSSPRSAVIAADIGHDHFLVWRIDKSQAAALVTGLRAFVSEGNAWLLSAAAEFLGWRLSGFPGIGCLRTAAWLVPCVLSNGRVGNAFVSRFIDHALLPHGWSLAGRNHTNIRLTAVLVTIGGQASAKAGAGTDAH